MPNMIRFRVTWTGFSGAPGVSTFYVLSSATTPDLNPALKTLFTAVAPYLPTQVVIGFPGQCDVLNSDDGSLVGSFTPAAQTSVTGTGGNTYVSPAGAQLRWLTGAVVGSKRVVGRTYLVPLSSTFATTGGIIVASCVSALQAAANAFISSVDHGIWSRPFTPKPGQPGTARSGAINPAVGADVPNKYVVLRSRRD